MPYYILVIIFSALLLPGIIGAALTLPGVPYMFVVALIFGLVDKFTHLTGTDLFFLGLVALISLIIDYASGILGAKFSGASKTGLIGGVIGFLLGLILLPPLGGFAGLFLGIMIAEFINFHHWKKALKAASGLLIGVLAGMVINTTLAIILMILFVLLAFR